MTISDEQARRLARNEALARTVNEETGKVAQGWYSPGEPMEFQCECSRAECHGVISIAPEEYERVRANGLYFVTLSGHADPEIERVIGHIRDYDVVEWTGPGAEVAAETDPRA